MRGFEIAKGFEDQGINLPVRKTAYAAGYDFEAAEDVVIPSFKKGDAPVLVKTGIKAYMEDDEVLYLYNRSSNPKKKGLILANGVGVIDKDYYENEENDGHFYFAFYNYKDEDREKIALIGYTHILWWTHMNMPDNKEKLQMNIKKVCRLLDKYDNVDVGL